jgi:hypothetical protein
VHVTVKKVVKNRKKKKKKKGIFRRMQKLVNFIIQTSQVDIAGYGEQIHFSAFQKSQRIAILGLFAKIMN